MYITYIKDSVRRTRNGLYVAVAMLALGFTACADDDLTTDQPDEDNPSVSMLTDDYQYKLPVIFHVLYQNAGDKSQYIPASRFRELIDYVNKIYQSGVYDVMENDESTNVHVTFELADKDENGNKLTTPGVEYVKWTGSYPIDCESLMSGDIAEAKPIIWEPNDYINVMVYPFASDAGDEMVTLGITHMPYTTAGDNALEGLQKLNPRNYTKESLSYPYCSSINSTYVWKNPFDGDYYQSSRYTDPNSSSYTVNTADVVVTLAHELGHYLGLFHTYSEQNSDTESVAVNDCIDSDYCDDTFSYDRPAYEEWLNGYMSSMPEKNLSLDKMLTRTDCEGNDQRSTDIMDYFWTLGYKITADQCYRIRQVLYYSPLMPGLKKTGSVTTKAVSRSGEDAAVDTILNRPHIVKCTIPASWKGALLYLK